MKNIAVVTGASSGIGREFACQIDDFGLDELWLVARSVDKLEGLASWLSTPIKILPLDLTRDEDVQKYVSELQSECPNIVYLVNDSGFGKFGRYDEISHVDVVDMIDLNVKALVLITLNSIPYMREGSGIIQMSSAAAFNPLPNFNVYASTKAFVYHFSRALRRELRDKGIGVTVACPSWVETSFFEDAGIDKTQNSPKKLLPMATAEQVVAKAIQDADNDKAVSVYGICTKIHRLAAKVLPDCILIAKWMCMQMKK